MSDERCPTCGSPVTVASGDEGTSYYVPGSDERRKGVDMRPCAGDEVNAAWAEVNRLRSRLAEVEQERDLAIAHDRQLYPTAHAYEKACAALNEQRERAERAEAALMEIASAADAWDSTLSSWCDGEERDRLRVAVVAAQRLLASVPSSLDAPKADAADCHKTGGS